MAALMSTVSTPPLKISHFTKYWAIWPMLLGGGISLISTVVYFSWAAPLTQVKIGEILGAADNQVLVNNQAAKTGTTLATGQQILTLPAARVSLKQADAVVARLSTQAAATLERDCIQLGEGQLVVAGVPGCVGAAIAQGEGAIVVLERLGTLGEVKVLAGEVTLSVPSNPALGTIALRKNQKITLSLTGDEIGPVRLMLPTEVDDILAGELFQGFQVAIANQAALIGLAPPTVPSPAPPAGVNRTPTPAKRLSAPPPADKVPPPPPTAPVHAPQSSEPRSQHRPTSASDYGKEAEPDSSYRSSHPANVSAVEFYHRPTRRRRAARAPHEAFSYSRPRSRSTYSGHYSGQSHRRRPAYSAPSYSAPPTATPTAPTHDLPAVPEAPMPELPTPIELPPATPPGPEPLPPPAVAEPPLEVPPLK